MAFFFNYVDNLDLFLLTNLANTARPPQCLRIWKYFQTMRVSWPGYRLTLRAPASITVDPVRRDVMLAEETVNDLPVP